MAIKSRATVEDLYHVSENSKAELVNGELIQMSPTGRLPGSAAAEVFVSLRAYARRIGRGYAVPDNVDFLVNLPHRSSFSPDAAYYIGPDPGMRFLNGAPIFAVEVRSENDYGSQAEADIAARRADYFAAGTQVVWDVDLQSEEVVRVFRATDPMNPTIYGRGQIAEAQPALPDWTMPIDDLFV